jgi:hypothetical protein
MTAVHGNVQTCMAAVLHVLHHHVSQIWNQDPHPLFQYIIEEIRVHILLLGISSRSTADSLL